MQGENTTPEPFRSLMRADVDVAVQTNVEFQIELFKNVRRAASLTFFPAIQQFFLILRNPGFHR